MIHEVVLNTDSKPMPLKRHRFTRHGHRMYDPSAKDKKIWLTLIEIPNTLIEGPMHIDFEFTFQRPKSHYRTGKFSHLIKTSAPSHKISCPDIDNLVKFYLDAMNKKFFVDDAQVESIGAVKKYGEKDHVKISIKY